MHDSRISGRCYRNDFASPRDGLVEGAALGEKGPRQSTLGGRHRFRTLREIPCRPSRSFLRARLPADAKPDLYLSCRINADVVRYKFVSFPASQSAAVVQLDRSSLVCRNCGLGICSNESRSHTEQPQWHKTGTNHMGQRICVSPVPVRSRSYPGPSRCAVPGHHGSDSVAPGSSRVDAPLVQFSQSLSPPAAHFSRLTPIFTLLLSKPCKRTGGSIG